MKKIGILFFALVFILPPIVGWADEYVLVMSKEDNVCQYMLKVYNEDLRKYGEIKYEEHEEFTAIKWEEKKYYWEAYGNKHYDDVLMSRFDINNDGKEEIIIKSTGSIRGNTTYSLDIFKGEDIGVFKDEFDVKNFKKAIGSIGKFDKGIYELKEIPARQMIQPEGGRKGYAYYYYISPHFNDIRPLVYNSSVYTEMIGGHDYKREWSVILRYTKENKLKDICYYFRAIDCEEKTQKGRK